MSIYYVEKEGRRYAYESTSHRVEGKKNPVSTNVYLGVVDPETGEIIPKKVRPKQPSPPEDETPKAEDDSASAQDAPTVPTETPELFALRYGPVVFLDAVQRSMGIEEDLAKAFPDKCANILACAMAQVMEPSVMDEVHITMEDSVLSTYLRLRGSLSPATICDLTKEVGMSLDEINEFFNLRYARHRGESYSIDITSESSYSKLDGWSEWGHNRDGESLPQVNWLLTTGSQGEPLSFEMLPGSVADITTLSEATGRLRSKGLDGRILIDRGFESASNVRMLVEDGLDFIVPSNVDSKALKKILTDSYSDVRDPRRFGTVDGKGYGHVTATVWIVPRNGADGADGYMYANEGAEDGVKCSAHVIFDRSSELDSNEKYLVDLLEMKSELEGLTLAAASKKLQKSRLSKAIGISEGEKGGTVAEINWNSVSFACNRAGIYILLTREGTGWEEAVSGYSLRNEVEEAFDAYKNDLDGKRNRTSDADRARGRFFIRYIALMMIVRMRRGLREYRDGLPPKMRKDDKVHRQTVRSLIRSLNTLIAVGSPGDWRLTHVTKLNRQIFSAFGLGEVRTSSLMTRTDLSFEVKEWPEKRDKGVSCKK